MVFGFLPVQYVPLNQQVLQNCCDSINDPLINQSFQSVEKKLNQSLLNKYHGPFFVNAFEFCGSFREGTRIREYVNGMWTIEFDILAISGTPGSGFPEQDSCMFLNSVIQELSAAGGFTVYRTIRGEIEILFDAGTGIRVEIDLHAAVRKGTDQNGFPVYEVLMHPPRSERRKSFVVREIFMIQSAPEYILPFRILKYMLQLIPEDVRFMKYHLKMAVLHHIYNRYPISSIQEITIRLINFLLSRYESGHLENIHNTGENLLKQQHVATGVKWLRHISNVLKLYFYDANAVQQAMKNGPFLVVHPLFPNHSYVI